MRDRPVVAVIVALVALVVVVGVIIAVSAIDVSAVGLRVNGHEASQQSIDDELKDFADSPVFASSYAQSGARLKTTKGAVNSIAAAQWLAFRVQKTLAEEILARHHVRVTQTDVDKARSALEKQGTLEGLSGSAATQLSEYQAAVSKLIKTLGSPAAAASAVRKNARNAHVSIDPRYGNWNPRRVGICPPSGCRQFVSALPSAQ
jgi:NhaP-type Na+/H+ or K+/H+ antiporter